MDVYYLGGETIKIKTASGAILLNPTTPGVKLDKLDTSGIGAIFYSDSARQDADSNKYPDGVVKFTTPGEFEVNGFSVVSKSTEPYNEVYGTKSSNIYIIDLGGGNTVGYIPHSTKDLPGAATELLSGVKLLIIPVGGLGLSMEPEDAKAVVKELEPEFVLPVHYDDGKTSYESPQASIGEFLKLSSQEPEVFDRKLSLKSLSSTSNSTQVVQINP